MSEQALLLHNPQALPAERWALLSIEPATATGQVLVRVALGARRRQLSAGTAYGPFPQQESAQRLAYVAEQLANAGYQPLSSHHELIDALSAAARRQRALAAANLGWRKATDAVPALLDAAAHGAGDVPVIIDALGRIGDMRALELCREQAARKLLSRRRSAVEALRQLGDQAGLLAARERGLQRLPDELRAVLLALDENDDSEHTVSTLVSAVQAVDLRLRGLALDQLYEFASPLCVAAVRQCLQEGWEQPHLWRYTKSIWKRAMLRADVDTFAQLALAFERLRGRSRGARVMVRSGLDGQSRKSPIFCPRTQAWVVRASARWLRRLAYWRPALYVQAAAAVLPGYGHQDTRQPSGLQGEFAGSLMLYRLLHGAGPRFRVDASGRVLARSAALAAQHWSHEHVPFMRCWEAHPAGYLSLAAFAQLPDVLAFGRAGVLGHPQVLGEAGAATLAALLDSAGYAPEQPRQLLSLVHAELQRRITLTAADLPLYEALFEGGARARALALDLLAEPARWAWMQAEDFARLLRRRGGDARDCAAQALSAALATLTSEQRLPLLAGLLQDLGSEHSSASPEPASALVDVLSTHAPEAAGCVGLEQILAWIAEGSVAQQQVAGALLAHHDEALRVLGSARLAVLADNPVQSVRAAACQLVERELSSLQEDPWPLLALAESRFPDTRRCALELLQQLDIAGFDEQALLALCDSSQLAVQQFARQWMSEHLLKLDCELLLLRLIEHPHAAMRGFALHLMEQHLPAGADALQQVAPFLRASLLVPQLGRAAKDRLLRVTERRGLQDAQQAAIACDILATALRSNVQRDFEALVLALSRIQLRFPELVTDWQLGLVECSQ